MHEMRMFGLYLYGSGYGYMGAFMNTVINSSCLEFICYLSDYLSRKTLLHRVSLILWPHTTTVTSLESISAALDYFIHHNLILSSCKRVRNVMIYSYFKFVSFFTYRFDVLLISQTLVLMHVAVCIMDLTCFIGLL
jgi:hypothetical protein